MNHSMSGASRVLCTDLVSYVNDFQMRMKPSSPDHHESFAFQEKGTKWFHSSIMLVMNCSWSFQRVSCADSRNHNHSSSKSSIYCTRNNDVNLSQSRLHHLFPCSGPSFSAFWPFSLSFPCSVGLQFALEQGYLSGNSLPWSSMIWACKWKQLRRVHHGQSPLVSGHLYTWGWWILMSPFNAKKKVTSQASFADGILVSTKGTHHGSLLLTYANMSLPYISIYMPFFLYYLFFPQRSHLRQQNETNLMSCCEIFRNRAQFSSWRILLILLLCWFKANKQDEFPIKIWMHALSMWQLHSVYTLCHSKMLDAECSLLLSGFKTAKQTRSISNTNMYTSTMWQHDAVLSHSKILDTECMNIQQEDEIHHLSQHFCSWVHTY